MSTENQFVSSSIPGIDTSVFDPAYFLQLVGNGLANGAIYAFVGLAVVLIYRTTGHINFAQGEMGTFGCLVLFTLAITNGVPYVIAIPLVLAGSFLVGAGIERTLIRPAQHRDALMVVVLTLGLLLTFNAMGGLIWGTQPMKPPTFFPDGADDQWVLIDGSPSFILRYSTVMIWASLALTVIALYWLLQRTRLGLAYRAVATNRQSAEMVGIPVGRMLMLGWGLSGAVGTLGAIMFAQRAAVVDFNFMASVLIYGFAAATLGGFDSIPGAVLGGAIVGLAESVIPQTVSFIGSEGSLIMAFVVILVVLLVRPQGLLGVKRIERV